MDPITDIVTLLRPHAVFSKPITGKGNWGVRYAAYKEPGFAIVLQGQCWLAVRGREPVLLERGDFVLLPASPAFALSAALEPNARREIRRSPASGTAIRTESPSSKCWAAHSASTRSTPRSSWLCCPRWSTSGKATAA